MILLSLGIYFYIRKNEVSKIIRLCKLYLKTITWVNNSNNLSLWWKAHKKQQNQNLNALTNSPNLPFNQKAPVTKPQTMIITRLN